MTTVVGVPTAFGGLRVWVCRVLGRNLLHIADLGGRAVGRGPVIIHVSRLGLVHVHLVGVTVGRVGGRN